MKRIFDLLHAMVDQNASDLLVTVGKPPILKIDGHFHELTAFGRMTQEDTQTDAGQLLENPVDKARFEQEGEVDFSVSIQQVGRFRVSIFRQRGSYALTVRRIYTRLPDPDELGIPDSVLALSRRKQGLVLVTGPAGCGKTTTLAALIDRINQERSCHVLTLEDPIEYLHRHQKSVINQREIGSDTRSYAQALRAALRQSPDVILIGEMRDLETISIALTAVETGHLVLSTLHTIGAAKTIDRIIDVFPPSQQQQIRVQLSTSLQAVVSQQLLPGLQTGLVPAFEVMLVNTAIRNMIRDGKTPQIDGVIQMGVSQGMTTMDMSLETLVSQKQVTLDQALLHAINPNRLTADRP